MEPLNIDNAQAQNDGLFKLEQLRKELERAIPAGELSFYKAAIKRIEREEPNEAQLEYAKKMNSPRVQKSNMRLISEVIASRKQTREHEPIMPIDQAKAEFWFLYKARLEETGRKLLFDQTKKLWVFGDGKPVFDGNLKIVVGELVAYFTHNKCTLDFNKGICLYGQCGIGKSFILEVFRQWLSIIKAPTCYYLDSCKKIVMDAASNPKTGFSIINNFCDKNHRCFDDFASEGTLNLYGNEVSAMEEIFMQRTDLLVKFGTITHCTSNILPKNDDIASMYGERIYSRMHQLFNFVLVTGYDKRQANQTTLF